MKLLMKCIIWRRGYSPFSGWVEEKDTELQGLVRSEGSQGEYLVVTAERRVDNQNVLDYCFLISVANLAMIIVITGMQECKTV